MILSKIWGLVARIYHFIDDYKYRARVRLLISRGLIIGKNVTISANAVIDSGYPYLIRIGDNSSIAEHVRVLAHDAATFKFTGGHTRLGKVEIKENCFIGDRSTILPGVTIGPNALIAAGSVVSRDIPPNSCAAGHPARVYAKFDDFIDRNTQQIEDGNVFSFAELMDNVDSLDSETKIRVWEAVQNGQSAYVKGFSGKNPYTWNVEE